MLRLACVFICIPTELPALLSLGQQFSVSAALDDLTTWRKDNEKDFDEAAIYYLKNNEATWTKWVPTDIADKVKAALAS